MRGGGQYTFYQLGLIVRWIVRARNQYEVCHCVYVHERVRVWRALDHQKRQYFSEAAKMMVIKWRNSVTDNIKCVGILLLLLLLLLTLIDYRHFTVLFVLIHMSKLIVTFKYLLMAWTTGKKKAQISTHKCFRSNEFWLHVHKTTRRICF